MREINRIIIHCAATPNGVDFTAADIDGWHRERGWRCIGYHHVIRPNGNVEPGRPIEEVGAHVRGYNKDSIGICMIGTDRFKHYQWMSLKQSLLSLSSRFPDATVHGHNEFDSHKTCPGFDVQAWIATGMRTPADHLLGEPA